MSWEEPWISVALALGMAVAPSLVVLRYFYRPLEGKESGPQAPLADRPVAPFLLLAGAASFRAIGPSWIERPSSAFGIAFLIVCLLVTQTIWTVGLRRRPQPRKTFVGMLVGVALLLAAGGVEYASRVGNDPRAISETAAGFRLALDPWDANAQLAVVWNEHRRGRSASAEQRLRIAKRTSPDPVRMAEVDAELLAARGECEAARRAFDRGLQALAERRTLEERFELGGFELPPALIANCGERGRD